MENTIIKKYGYGSETFVRPETMVTIITLCRIPISFVAIPVLQKFKKRPLYLWVSVFLLVVISGIIAFTCMVERSYISVEELHTSVR